MKTFRQCVAINAHILKQIIKYKLVPISSHLSHSLHSLISTFSFFHLVIHGKLTGVGCKFLWIFDQGDHATFVFFNSL